MPALVVTALLIASTTAPDLACTAIVAPADAAALPPAAICARVRAALEARVGAPLAIVDAGTARPGRRVQVAVRVLRHGVIEAETTLIRDRRVEVLPVVSIAVSDRPPALADIDQLAREIARRLPVHY